MEENEMRKNIIENPKGLSVRFSNQMFQQIRKAAFDNEISMGEMVRKIVEEYFN